MKANSSLVMETATVGDDRSSVLIGKHKPVGGTGEWASHNVNIQSGCRNGCRYCFSQCNAGRFKRHTPESWLEPEILMAKVNKGFRKRSGRIMFPTSHDIDPTNLDACLTVLRAMLDAGNDVLIVSKPNLECIRRLCAELGAFRGQITFRFTIGSASDKVLKAWEPNAPSFSERLASLRYAFNAGYQTSISCEPMLDGNIHEVIRQAKPFVSDSIWLGVANSLRGKIALNCPDDEKVMAMANDLIGLMSVKFIEALYARYKADPMIKWKDSIKKVMGLERPIEKGLDI